jgi:hypothetical protein
MAHQRKAIRAQDYEAARKQAEGQSPEFREFVEDGIAARKAQVAAETARRFEQVEAEARRAEAEALAAAVAAQRAKPDPLFIFPATQPEVEQRPKEPTPPWLRNFTGGLEAKPEAEKKPAAEPLPQVAVAPLSTVSFAADQPVDDVEPALLSHNAPYDNAREFVRRRCWKAGSLALFYWGESFWEWSDGTFRPVPEKDLRKPVFEFLDESQKPDGKNVRGVRFQPKPQQVNDLVNCLQSGLALPSWCEPPMRLHPADGSGR